MPPLSEHASADCRQRLIQAATDAFMEEGYRVSVDRIALRAGVAKQTLYNHFPGKGALFGEVVRRSTENVLVALNGDECNVRESLLRFSAAFRAKLLGESGLAMFRALISEVSRFPDLAKAFYQNGPAEMARRLADFLRGAMDRGQLRQDDPDFATEMLLGMLSGIERTRRLCGELPLAQEAEALRVTRIVDCFLGAYAPDRRVP